MKVHACFGSRGGRRGPRRRSDKRTLSILTSLVWKLAELRGRCGTDLSNDGQAGNTLKLRSAAILILLRAVRLPSATDPAGVWIYENYVLGGAR